ncbi:beta-1,3-galactosyltransferase 2 [Silurus meridionalis]|uniref:beta-1,3-galactosyltransferase 2 n=1 Tax=Silurus meridionalis TaxID=175797 RepID=UPI001EEB44C5|nr:beta-1,3-galactosyltransferase 2 [Silurus meridionalis]
MPSKSLRSRLPKVLFLAVLIALSLYVFEKWTSTLPSIPSHPQPSEVYRLISPSSYKYLLNQPDLCKNRKPFLVLLIPVTGYDSESRDAIRKTWGQENLIPDFDIARLFFIGQLRERDLKFEEDLLKESTTYGDIIQMDFLDTYHNLTIKTMMIMNWMASYCRSARYAMKIDADIFLNVPYLVKYLQSKAEHNFITGSVITDGRPRRDPNSKWFLSKQLYSENLFPPYVSGAGYVFSADLAKKISMASKFVRPIPMEDVYVGLCLHFLNIRPQFAWKLWPYRNLFEVRHLDYDRCVFAKRIIVTGFTSTQLVNMWTDLKNAAFSC